ALFLAHFNQALNMVFVLVLEFVVDRQNILTLFGIPRDTGSCLISYRIAARSTPATKICRWGPRFWWSRRLECRVFGINHPWECYPAKQIQPRHARRCGVRSKARKKEFLVEIRKTRRARTRTRGHPHKKGNNPFHSLLELTNCLYVIRVPTDFSSRESIRSSV